MRRTSTYDFLEAWKALQRDFSSSDLRDRSAQQDLLVRTRAWAREHMERHLIPLRALRAVGFFSPHWTKRTGRLQADLLDRVRARGATDVLDEVLIHVRKTHVTLDAERGRPVLRFDCRPVVRRSDYVFDLLDLEDPDDAS